MIKYFLEDNNLSAKGGQLAKVVHNCCYGKKSLVKMMAESGTTLTTTDLTAALELLEKTVLSCLTSGNSIKLEGFLNIKLNIKGVYKNRKDKVESDSLNVNASISKVMVEKIRSEANFMNIEKSINSPRITFVRDLLSKAANSKVSRGGPVEISGVKLNFNREREDEGIFIQYNNERWRKIPSEVIKGNAQSLNFSMPPWGKSGDRLYIKICKRVRSEKLRTLESRPLTLIDLVYNEG